MVPSSKRKAIDDSNPLLNAAKKAKKDTGKPNKRKLNGEELPGGLLIIREPSSQPVPGPSSQQPAAKKFRAASHDVERDVRDMDNEANALKQKAKSRPQTTAPASSIKMPQRGSTATPAKKRGKVTDETQPLPTAETPQINKNRIMRGEDSPGSDISNSSSKRGHRRRSSFSGRGKRVSDAFEASGAIVQPHNSIAPSSFYKHIDADEPESERLRQLFIWCASRAASSSNPSLPTLTPESAQILKAAQDDVIKMLAEKELLPTTRSPGKSKTTAPAKENEQNRLNRLREIRFSEEIRGHEMEVDEWARLTTSYETYVKNEHARIEKKKTESDGPPVPSAKARGKRRADSEDPSVELPRIDMLSPKLQSGLSLALSILGHPLPSSYAYAVPKEWHKNVENQAEMDELIKGLEFKLDTLHSYTNSAKATVGITETMLDQRFELLSAILSARSTPANPQPVSPENELVSRFVGPAPTRRGADTLTLFRALSAIDSQRPPSQVSDAARRAAKEVQRAEESGFGDRERRVTMTMGTPRKVGVGTPRRGTTPSK